MSESYYKGKIFRYDNNNPNALDIVSFLINKLTKKDANIQKVQDENEKLRQQILTHENKEKELELQLKSLQESLKKC